VRGHQSQHRATLRDVAARAGVAASTVSRALSHPQRVHPATRERIAQAVREADYRASHRRHEGTSVAHGSIALLIPDIANPFYAEITRGTQLQLTAAGFTQLLADTEESAGVEERSLREVGRLADGVVLAATRLSDEQLRAAAQATPLVLVNREVEGLASVCLETGLGFRQAIEHLVSLGHRTIAYLSGPTGSWSDRIRWDAIRAAGRGADVSTVRLGPMAPTFASGAAAADAVVNSRATACIAFNDLLAIGVIRRLTERGVAVPDQISVVGCDNIFAAEICTPPLTTVAGDLQAVGRTAIQILLTQLEDAQNGPAPVRLPTHLAIRGSTGPSNR
ncbi:MAG TPA: LacI family DNA-binding transcriptional regulator, partial [Solirubrobacteraceae bacterium]